MHKASVSSESRRQSAQTKTSVNSVRDLNVRNRCHHYVTADAISTTHRTAWGAVTTLPAQVRPKDISAEAHARHALLSSPLEICPLTIMNRRRSAETTALRSNSSELGSVRPWKAYPKLCFSGHARRAGSNSAGRKLGRVRFKVLRTCASHLHRPLIVPGSVAFTRAPFAITDRFRGQQQLMHAPGTEACAVAEDCKGACSLGTDGAPA